MFGLTTVRRLREVERQRDILDKMTRDYEAQLREQRLLVLAERERRGRVERELAGTTGDLARMRTKLKRCEDQRDRHEAAERERDAAKAASREG